MESGEAVGKGYEAVTLSSGVQQPLNRSDDDVRIDWGRLYLAVEPAGTTSVREENGRTAIQAQIPLEEGKEVLFALAYDEVFAIQYFGQNLEPTGKRNGKLSPACWSSPSRSTRRSTAGARNSPAS